MARTQAADYDDKREAIKATSARLFAMRGFHGSSISDISKACKVSKSNLYHYFESKEQVLFEILHDHANMLILSTEPISSNTSLNARQRLKEFARTLIRINTASRNEHALILNEIDCLPGPQARRIRKLLRRPIEVWFETLAEINPRLRSTPDLEFPAAMLLIGMINWTHTWFKESGPVSVDQFADLVCETFLNGFEHVRIDDIATGQSRP